MGVRCRPLSTKEKQKQSVKSVKILDEKLIIIQDVSAAKPEEVKPFYFLIFKYRLLELAGQKKKLMLSIMHLTRL